MSRIIKVTFLLFVLLLGVNRASHAQANTLMDIISSDLRLDELTAAINTAQLGDMLRGPGPYTILAPVDGTFSATRNSGDMRGLVLYHGIKGNYTNGDLKERTVVTSLLGPELQISNNRGVTINGQAKMVAINIAASNGTLHLISSMVLPSAEDIGGSGQSSAMFDEDTGRVPTAGDESTAAASGSAVALSGIALPDPGPSNISSANQNPAYVSGGLMPYWAGVSSDSSTCKGMTWVLQDNYSDISLVGSDRKTNPYRGDTSCQEKLPILCFYRDLKPRPPGAFNEGWSFGTVRATAPVQGYELKSVAVANEACRIAYGDHWRIAEYHDSIAGRAIGPISGHSFWARGNAPNGTRFWVSISDQPANPWNSVVIRNGPPVGTGTRIDFPGQDSAFVGDGPVRMTYAEGIARGKLPCSGMTWVIYRQLEGKVQVGTDERTNPFVGDQSCTKSFPVLCIKVDGYAVPANTNGLLYSHGWSAGIVALTAPVTGDDISTRAKAANLCTSSFGNAWRMAEFHDGSLGVGGAGWAFWAYGSLPTGQRFWVANNDQLANPWNR